MKAETVSFHVEEQLPCPCIVGTVPVVRTVFKYCFYPFDCDLDDFIAQLSDYCGNEIAMIIRIVLESGRSVIMEIDKVISRTCPLWVVNADSVFDYLDRLDLIDESRLLHCNIRRSL